MEKTIKILILLLITLWAPTLWAQEHRPVLDYGNHQMKDTGLTAMLNYRLNDHWDASVFVQKSLMLPRVTPEMWWMDDIGDKIGASVRYSPSPSFSLQLSVWDQRRPIPIK